MPRVIEIHKPENQPTPSLQKSSLTDALRTFKITMSQMLQRELVADQIFQDENGKTIETSQDALQNSKRSRL